MKKKKGLVTTSAVVLAMLATGTFAWTSFSQRALNDKDGTKVEETAGGRVHDDYHKDSGNKDVYAENYGEKDLIVRIKLSEYLELDGKSQIKTDAEKGNRDTWTPITGTSNTFNEYVAWTMGGSKDFMPTFHTDNTSLVSDASGDGRNTDNSPTAAGAANGQGDGTHNAFTAGDTAVVGGVTHTAKPTQTQTGAPMTMAEWEKGGKVTGKFWVIDTDGWAYWAELLKPGEGTALLLNEISTNFNGKLNDHDWYYGIDVIGEFATTDDKGKFPGLTPGGSGESIIEEITKDPTGGGETPEPGVGYDFIFNYAGEMEAGTSQKLGLTIKKDGAVVQAGSTTWSVTGDNIKSTVDPITGEFVASPEDAGKTITVTVTTTDPDKSESFEIKINDLKYTYSMDLTATETMDAGTSQNVKATVFKESLLGQEDITATTPLIWTVTGGSAGTTIDNNGKLTVAEADAGKTLVVKAASTNPAVSKEATVKVNGETFTYDFKWVDDVPTNALKGDTSASYAATLTRTSNLTGKTENIDSTVKYEISGQSTGGDLGTPTSIDATGKLYVKPFEESTITVTASSSDKEATPISMKVKVSPIAVGTKFDFFGEEYIYLQDKLDGNRLVLRNYVLPTTSQTTVNYNFNALDNEMRKYYIGLSDDAKSVVQPVQSLFDETAGGTMASSRELYITNPPEDYTTVTLNGEKKAFALSAADINDVSGPGKAFPTKESRMLPDTSVSKNWFLRTPSTTRATWGIDGEFFSGAVAYYNVGHSIGVRPGLIINQ